MKKLIIATIVCCAAILPATPLQAAPWSKYSGGPQSAIGFPVGKSFAFKVREKISSKTQGTKVVPKTPVPDGIPDFDKGEKVKFTIGSKGEIKGAGFSVPYKENGGTVFIYATLPTKSNPRANVIQVFKDSENKPTGVFMTFFKTSGSGFNTTVNLVTYGLN